MPPRFRYLEPTFFAGLLDDPLLYLRMRPLGRGLLFDCGQLHHLAKRTLRSLDAVFVSHAHMDHFMGIDTLVRSAHVAPRTLSVYGPPGLAAKLAHKLRGYDWNLCEPWWGSLRVHEYDGHGLQRYFFSGPEGFTCRSEGQEQCDDGLLLENTCLKVRAAFGDHTLPVLAFRIDEQPGFAVDPRRLEERGMKPGPWLASLQQHFVRGWQVGGAADTSPAWPPESAAETRCDPQELYHQIRLDTTPASIGYLTDVGFSPQNRAMCESFLGGLTLLVCECSFLAADRQRARRSGHLCSGDLNALLAQLRPRYVLPMHLSKLYLGRGEELYRELLPPAGTRVLRLPEHLLPPPLLPRQVRFHE